MHSTFGQNLNHDLKLPSVDLRPRSNA